VALFRSDRVTQASGSIGGTTFSHNRFGMYFRARRSPVNPNTTFQQSQRDAFAAASAGWRALTDAQRADWNAYAAATPVTNALGETCFLAGAGQFVATNAFSLRLGLTLVTAAPLTPGKQAIGSPTVVADVSAFTIVVADIDAALNGELVAVFLGSPISAGVNFFAGPYQLRGSGTVAAGTFTVATAAGRNGLPFVAGQRLPYRVAGITADGRLSTVASGVTVAVA
jgi:hypothetical protein